MSNNQTNGFLASLSDDCLRSLQPHLHTLQMSHGAVLYEAGDKIERVAFPLAGALVSIVVPLCDGQLIEAGIVGQSGIVGGSAILNGQQAVNRAMIQIPGPVAIIEKERLLACAASDSFLLRKIADHEEFMFAQAQQSAACNAVHLVEARLCRWLLQVHDVTGSDTLRIKQELLAQILGARRTTVSLVAGQLQNAGLIRCRRGVISLVDFPGLEEGACECRSALRHQHDRLLGCTVSGTGVTGSRKVNGKALGSQGSSSPPVRLS
jgi:CRP-like cAMP-binding protein